MSEETARLVRELQDLMASRELRPGERLGSERDLAERLGVPRTALRRALERLEADGLVRRIMGRSGGVYASDGRIERQINTTAGIPAMLRQQGVVSHTTVLDLRLATAAPAEARALRLGRADSVVRIVRRRDADGRPWSLDTSVLPATLVPGLLGRDLGGSLYEVLARDYGIEPAEADETVDVIGADDALAAHLDVLAGAPVLQVWRVSRTSDGLPFEFARDLFRADRTRMHLHRYGPRWKRARVTPL